MNLEDEPGTRGCSSTTCAARSTASATTARPCGSTWTSTIRSGASACSPGPRARLPELRLPSAVRAGRHARLRQVLHLHRHHEHDAAGRFHYPGEETTRTIRCCSSGRRRRRARPPTTAAPPRELFRLRQPFANHNARSHRRSIRTPRPAAPEFGLLYVGVADGGSGGDPMRLAQNLGVGVRQDLPHRSARHEQPQQEIRDSCEQSVREKPRTRCRRSMRSACATRSASRGIRATATCSSPTSARTSSRR